ncbi:MAG: hypothetical protein OXE40_11690 [Gammaproteobacteria bacterium]|nr:hypothetical protein [Gammaproteobacteria bacterium]
MLEVVLAMAVIGVVGAATYAGLTMQLLHDRGAIPDSTRVESPP